MNQPNEFIDPQGPAFGRAGARWVAADGADAVDLAAAYFQHRAAMALNQRLEAGRALSRKHLVDTMGGGQVAALHKKLRGDLPVRLDDLLRWWAYAGPNVLPPWPTTTEGFLPTPYHQQLAGWAPGQGRPTPTLRAGEVGLDPGVLMEAARSAVESALDQGTEHLLARQVLRQAVIEGGVQAGVDPDVMRVDQDVDGSVLDLVVNGLSGDAVNFLYADTLRVATAADQARFAGQLLDRLYALAARRLVDANRLLVMSIGGKALVSLRQLSAGLAAPKAGESLRLPLGWSVARGVPEAVLPARARETDLEIRCVLREELKAPTRFLFAVWELIKAG